MSICPTDQYKAEGDYINVDKNTHEWKARKRIFDLERRLNRERTTIRLIKDLKESLEAKVYAQDKTIKQLETELKSTKEELVELNRCSAKKDTQLETFRILIAQHESDRISLKQSYNLQLDSITKILQQNHQHVVSELEEQVRSQKQELAAKDNAITRLKFSNEEFQMEISFLSNNINQLKASIGINDRNTHPLLMKEYVKKQVIKQSTTTILSSQRPSVNLESFTSEASHRVNTENASLQQVLQSTTTKSPSLPGITNNENIDTQHDSKDDTRKLQNDNTNTVKAITPQKRPLHSISTNQHLVTPKCSLKIKREIKQANTKDIIQLDKENDPLVAVKAEQGMDNQSLYLDLSDEQISNCTVKADQNSTSNVKSDSTLKDNITGDQSISKKRNVNKTIDKTNRSNTATSSRLANQGSITSSSISSSSSSKSTINNQQSSRLPVSAGHQHHRAHMTGETCIACINFYGSEPIIANVHGEQVQVTSNDRIQAHSRHRHTKRATTPPGFWEMDFASPPENDRSRRYCK